MPKYLIIWEGDMSRQPVDYKERAQGYKQALAMVKADFDSGLLKDWGIIPGQLKGYWIVEVDSESPQLGLMMEKYRPFFAFPEIYPIATYDRTIEHVNIMLESN